MEVDHLPGLEEICNLIRKVGEASADTRLWSRASERTTTLSAGITTATAPLRPQGMLGTGWLLDRDKSDYIK